MGLGVLLLFKPFYEGDVLLHRRLLHLALKLAPGILLGAALEIGKSRTGPAHITFGALFIKAVKLEQDIVGRSLGQFGRAVCRISEIFFNWHVHPLWL